MPLAPIAINLPVNNPHYVRFPMEDRGRTVTVHIAASWLRQCGARDRLTTRNLSLLCNYYREKIEAAASVKFDQLYCDGADIVVVASDLE